MISSIRSKIPVTLALVVILISRIGMADADSSASEIKPFAIEFLNSKVAFSGSIDSKNSADALGGAILSARPDLKIVNTGMDFNPKVNLPNMKLLQSLLVEIALSTQEGVFEISDDTLLIGGLTDSVVTGSVMRLRAAPILEGRRFREQLCLIPTEDLPEIPILLSTGESRRAFSFDLELRERKEVNFEPPGIILTKILSLIEGTSGASGLFPEEPEPTLLTKLEPVTDDEPLVMAPELSEPEFEAPALPPPPSPYEELGPILFARNSFILQSGQREVVDQVASLLKSDPWQGRPVILRALIYQSGSEAFASWLSERRTEETVRQLTAAGIESTLLKPESANTLERIDKGEVKVLILKAAGTEIPAPEL